MLREADGARSASEVAAAVGHVAGDRAALPRAPRRAGQRRAGRPGTAAAADPRSSTAGCARSSGAMLVAPTTRWRWLMSRVAHFEIQADDPERAKAFYAAVFDWTFEDYGQMTGSTYWGITTGPEDAAGINGGLLQRPAPAPAPEQGANAFVCTVVVDDFDDDRTAHPRGRRPGRAAQDGPHRDGVAGLLPRHRGQHVRDPPARSGRRLRVGRRLRPPARRPAPPARRPPRSRSASRRARRRRPGAPR